MGLLSITCLNMINKQPKASSFFATDLASCFQSNSIYLIFSCTNQFQKG